ncbi:serine/threonine-protein kinase [Streptomyces aculeolatus]
MRELEPGDPRAVGRFRILARVGSGGMAVVYLRRSAGGRAVAVKVMHAEFADDPEHRARFHREVAAARAVGGTYSPGVLDAAPDAPTPWMATEFLPAVSLREAVERFGPLPAGSAWSLAAGLAEALALVHRAGFVHLDVKPANVLLAADGPRLIDFGIAAEPGAGDEALGTAAGSRGFMSPEQEAGAGAGPSSDVFSLGSTLAYACTGAPPAAGSPVPVADDGLRAVIEGCLRPYPSDRPGLPELVGRLASPGPRERRTVWPPQVAAEIDRRIAQAGNPPVALPRSAGAPVPLVRRRALLLGAGAVVAGLGAGTPLVIAYASRRPGDEAAPEHDPSPRPTRSEPPAAESPAASPAARSRVLEFFLTGDVALTSLTYSVDGRTTTLEDVALPWRTAVDIPEYPPSVPWRLEYAHEPGAVGYRVMVDRIMHGQGGDSGTGGEDEGTA